MKWRNKILLCILVIILTAIGFVVFSFVFQHDTQAAPSYLWAATGMSEKPDGTPISGTCYTLTFDIPRAYVVINNQTGSDAYYVMNDTGCNAGSSYYDHVLDDGEDAFWDGWLKVEHLTVYITPTTGFTVAGW